MHSQRGDLTSIFGPTILKLQSANVLCVKMKMMMKLVASFVQPLHHICKIKNMACGLPYQIEQINQLNQGLKD